MKRFAATFFLIMAGVLMTDRVTGYLLHRMMLKANNTMAEKMRTLVYEDESDIILLGTSRCLHHYVPSIIQQTVDMTVYNGGFEGTDNIYAHYFLLCILVERHVPKVVVVDAMQGDCSSSISEPKFCALPKFAPYIGINREADSLAKLNDKYFMYQISHICRYNPQALANVGGMFLNTKKERDNGYVPMNPPYKFPVMNETSKRAHTDEDKLDCVRRFIAKCKAHNIKVIFSASPYYTHFEEGAFKPLKEVLEENEVPFIDNLELFNNNAEMFYDNGHLWDEGARRFSQTFANQLKEVLDYSPHKARSRPR